MSTPAPYPRFDGTENCSQPGADPEAFFPATGDESKAVALCGSCPWQGPCLNYALTHQVIGVWGGTSSQERQRIRRRSGVAAEPLRFLPGLEAGRRGVRPPCGTVPGYMSHARRKERPCRECWTAKSAADAERRDAS